MKTSYDIELKTKIKHNFDWYNWLKNTKLTRRKDEEKKNSLRTQTQNTPWLTKKEKLFSGFYIVNKKDDIDELNKENSQHIKNWE